MARKSGPHATLCKNAVDWLTLQGAFVWVNNTGMLRDRNGRPVRFGKRGCADIIGVLPGGRFFGAEAKFGRDVLRADQVEWAERVEERGGYVCVFHDLYELEECYAEAMAMGDCDP